MDNSFLVVLKKQLEGGVINSPEALRLFSHDASIFELTPEVVVEPKNTDDIKRLVNIASKYKSSYPGLGITPRGAGTDMTGGAIGSSIILDMTKHIDEFENLNGNHITAQAGAFLRDIEPLLESDNLQLGSAPESKEVCTIGGAVGNNAGGEQSLRFGNTARWVKSLRVILSDGNEYLVKPLNRSELKRKTSENSFEGRLYKNVYDLIENNYDLIKNSKPKSSKNSMGYNLWDVWDRETGIFDLTQLFTGSQGTLGIMSEVTLEAVPKLPYTGTLVVYLSSVNKLGEVINTVLKHRPATFEGFDNITFGLGVKYFKVFRRQLGTKEYLRQQRQLLKSVLELRGRVPNLCLMIGFDGESSDDVTSKIDRLRTDLRKYKLKMAEDNDSGSSAPLRQIRKASRALLSRQFHGRYAAPFIDDMAVRPKHLPKFIPEIRKIIRKYKLPVTLSGHFGDGNFHLIPLLDISSPKDQAKLEPMMRELIPVVLKYGGTMSGEHGDGMVRGPWLPAVFGDEMYHIFKQIKELFDPLFIFNPHKKTDASWQYSIGHIRRR